MKTFTKASTLLGLLILMLVALPSLANEYQGTVSAGYVYTDIEGNQGVHQPTYNLYEGAALSLERFRYQWDSGLLLTANITNITLNNRHINLGFSKPGHAGINVQHSAYMRTYSFDGADFTRRRSTSGSAWFKPIRQLKIFGGYGVTDKHGRMPDLFEPAGGSGLNFVDYTHSFYNIGAEFKHERSYGRLEYFISDFCDDLSRTNDRSSRRIKFSAFSPIPRYERVVVNFGYQHYEQDIEYRYDTLTANTFWGGARYAHPLGYHVQYTFMFDRARRTGDLTDADKIVNAIYVGKTWRGRGGVTAGYGHLINDDVLVARAGDQYSLSGWVEAIENLRLRGGISYRTNEVDSGRTLTGDIDYARHFISAKYRFGLHTVRVKIEDRHRSNDDIGTDVDFMRASTDIFVSDPRYGDLSLSYSIGDGSYEQAEGLFDYTEHVLSGDLLSREYRKFQGGIGGVYYRAKQDVDVESFTLRFTGRYRVHPRAQLEIVYSAHNFDNFYDVSRYYSEYYTANVVEFRVNFEL